MTITHNGSQAADAGTPHPQTDLAPAHAWRGFTPGPWTDEIDVRGFIGASYTPYEGDARFLEGPTERTNRVWNAIVAMFPAERERGVYDVDPATPSTITSHAPGYINADDTLIVGLQTDAPLRTRRAAPSLSFPA